MAPDPGQLLDSLIDHLGLTAAASRRGFLKTALGTAMSVSALGALARQVGTAPFVIVEDAEGVIVVDTTRCVGCRRCELACTEFNDGKAQPSLARIKVARNYNFGPRGQQAGFGRAMGQFGNFRVTPDICLQCPHPVPCAIACPNDAILLDKKTRARVVDAAQCNGCKLCQAACPWEVMTFDDDARKASKCFLCGGAPACVEACPTLALQYVSWRDLTRAVPIRQAVLPSTRDYRTAGCTSCHPETAKRRRQPSAPKSR